MARPARSTHAQPLVSVVTPVYQGERYLAECIESVLGQTYQEWEHVIVDNGSTDASLDIAQHYAGKDARIRVHHNAQNRGVIRNHNTALGLIAADSRYCKVLQADDVLFPECLEQMVAVAEAHPSVGLVGSYNLHGTRVACDGLPYPTTVIGGRELARLTLLGAIYLFLSPSSLLIRAEHVRARPEFYPGEELHADVAACYEVLRSSDFGFVHQVLTFIRRHNASLTTSLSLPFNTFMWSNTALLLEYGPVYLDAEEYAARLERQLTAYHRFLAMNLLRGRRPRGFWRYHRQGLARLGHPLRLSDLARTLLKGVALEGLGFVVDHHHPGPPQL
jgi:glycosyltransferase involved in cell wall biosynthesis